MKTIWTRRLAAIALSCLSGCCAAGVTSDVVGQWLVTVVGLDNRTRTLVVREVAGSLRANYGFSSPSGLLTPISVTAGADGSFTLVTQANSIINVHAKGSSKFEGTFKYRDVVYAVTMERSRDNVLADVAVAEAAVMPDRVTGQQLIDGFAKRLSPHEVTALLRAGTSIETVRPGDGNYLRWTNNADGSMVASGLVTGYNKPITASGTWRVSDAGALCIELNWHPGGEKWCRNLYLLGRNIYLGAADLAAQRTSLQGLIRIQN